MPKNKVDKELVFLWGILIIVIVMLGFSIFSIWKPIQQKSSTSTNPMMQKMSMMSLTDFDKAKGRELMDKDNDGICDFCGMPIEMCLDSGEMQCSMDPNSKIGKLGTQHIHSDLKIYINGNQFDFSPVADRHEKQMHGDMSIKDTSAFIHIHPATAPEKAGDVLHMHSTGINLGHFFESIGLKLTKECINSLDGKSYCNGAKNKLKMFSNERQVNSFEDQVFNDLDKILITYGDEDEQEIKKQIESITDFAKLHSEKSAESSSQIQLPDNVKSAAPMKFASIEEEIEYMKKNAKNPNNIDVELAVRNMDKNLDGICDKCGMAILHCIETGMQDM